MDVSGVDDDLPRLGGLADPVRRALYRCVVAAGAPIGRDAVAERCDVSRSLAAYHLDLLAEDGLLDVSFERLTGRTGPGAGRPAKLYRRAARAFSVSVPPRDYEVAAQLLAAAVAGTGAGKDVHSELARVTRTYGIDVGTALSDQCPGRARSERLRCLRAELAARGYEPVEGGTTIRLGNCPFDTLATQHRDVACGMNLELLRGVLEAFGGTGLAAHLEPHDGQCCVVFRPE